MAALLIAVLLQTDDEKLWKHYCTTRDAIRQVVVQKIDALEKELALADRGRISPRATSLPPKAEGKPPVYRSARDKQFDMERIKNRIAAYRKALTQELPLSIERRQTGDIGELPRAVKIVQVIDAKTCLVKIRLEESEQWLWLEVATDGFLDGEMRTMGGLFSIVGTKKYNTAIGGSNTILHVRTFIPPKAE